MGTSKASVNDIHCALSPFDTRKEGNVFTSGTRMRCSKHVCILIARYSAGLCTSVGVVTRTEEVGTLLQALCTQAL